MNLVKLLNLTVELCNEYGETIERCDSSCFFLLTNNNC